MKNIISIISLIIISILLYASDIFTLTYTYAYVLSLDYDGKVFIDNEKNVKNTLEQIIENADKYTMKAYNRTAISYKLEKTKGTTHSFYVIMSDDNYLTLSFSATGKFAVSKGAWAINTESDVSSYENYMSNNNIWKVEEINPEDEINTLSTITNVIEYINKDITYYYFAKVNDKDKVNNCNTALLETLTVK